MHHHTIRFMPDDCTVSIHAGATLLEAAGQAGVILSSPCGGIGRCGKCRVQILPGGKDVLACQYTVQRDLEVHVPEQSRFLRQQILRHGIGRDVPLEPMVRKVFVPGPWRGIEAFFEAVQKEGFRLCRPLDEAAEHQRATLAAAPANDTAGLTAVLLAVTVASDCCFRWIGTEVGDTSGVLFGAAIDVGTTTVVVNLIDLVTGRGVAASAEANPQARYGADVISRIQYAAGPHGDQTLQQAILSCINALIANAARTAHISKASIYEVVVAGNTTMSHLLLNLPVAQLGQAPYRAYSVAACDKTAADMGLDVFPQGQLHTIENIAGFVGSDTLAAALAGGLDEVSEPTLLVDIGTNGELVLAVGEKLWAASCAAGPALEGAGIEFGSSARDGAIQRVIVNDTDIDLDVIGGGQATSICGSGLIDAVAALLDLGIVDETGRFVEPKAIFPAPPKAIAERLTAYNENPAFRLSAPNADVSVFLTQKDIRQFQLAKAAIRAGIQLLCLEASLPEDNLARILLAGAFGNYIQRESAVRVGLLPGPNIERIRFVGNAAGAGATMILVSRHARSLAAELAGRIAYVEIAHQVRFQEAFSMCLLFPDKQ